MTGKFAFISFIGMAWTWAAVSACVGGEAQPNAEPARAPAPLRAEPAAQLQPGPQFQEGGPFVDAQQPPGSPARYYTEIAAIHQRYHVYDKAEECLKKAIELEQSTAASADYAYQLGRLYLEWGKPDEAEAMFEFSIEQTPDAGSALITRCRELAQVYESAQQFDKADALYRKALAKSSGFVAQAVERDYFTFARKTGKLDSIITEKEKQLAADPKDVRILGSLSYLYHLQGNKTKEIDVYKAIIAQNPKDTQSLAMLALAYRDAGDTENAVAAYKSLIEVNPPARPYYITEIAKLYARAGNTRQVEEWAGKLMDEKDLATAAGRARLAKLYQDTGSLDKSVEQYKTAITLAADPRQRDAYQLQLARAYLMAGKYGEAEDLAKKITTEAKDPSIQQEARSVLVRIAAEKDRENAPEKK